MTYRMAKNQIKEYGIYLIIMAAGLVGLILSNGHPFGEYLSLYIFKPGIKLMIALLVSQFSFRKIDFSNEILSKNVAAAIVFFGICYIVAEAM